MERLTSYEADRLNDALYGMDTGGEAQSSVTARFVRTDQDGTTWVRFEGAGKDTPLTSAMSVMARQGDLIDVRLGGYEATGGGNRTDPSAGYQDVRAVNIEVEHVKGKQAEFEKLTAQELEAEKARIGHLEADSAEITELVAQKASIADLQAAEGRISDLESDHVSTTDLTAVNGEITNLKTTKANVSDLEANYITADDIEATYMHANMSNSDVAWIQNGVIKDGAISSAMINTLSANKIVGGTADFSKMNVVNLKAGNIEVDRINGQPVTGKTVVDALTQHESDISDLDSKLDDAVDDLQGQIDGAIETWTGTEVPTLLNTPASAWTTDDDRRKHVGDVYFVVNSNSQQNGYNYRFTKTGNEYSWQLIKDSDVTNALQRLTTAEGKISTFDSDISTLKTDTGEIKTRTTNLETRMSDAEDDILDRVEKTTFNELSSTVDENSATITTHSTVLSNNGLTTTTNISNTVNSVSQTATSNSSKISQLTTTLGTNADGTSAANDVVHRVSDVEQDLDGITTRVSKTEAHIVGDFALSTTAAGTTTKVATITPSVTGWTLEKGVSVTVRFDKENTVASPTLNVNSTGAKAIRDYAGNALAESAYKWKAGTAYSFTYDGTYWRLQDSLLTSRVTQAESTITQQAGLIEAKVSKDGVIAAINLSTETEGGSTAKISADKVNITGTAIFSALGSSNKVVTATQTQWYSSTSATTKSGGSWATTQPSIVAGHYIWQREYITYSDGSHEYKPSEAGVCVQGQTDLSAYSTTEQANALYDSAGSASAAQAAAISAAASDATSKANAAEQNAKAAIPTDISDLNNDTGFITNEDVPTKVSELQNDSGFQNSTQVNNTITSKGYQTSAQVESAITSKGYQTASQVSTAVSNGTANLAAKADAVARTQRIYYRQTASGSAPGVNNTWLSTSGTGYGNWSLSIPQLTSGETKYPKLYMATQTQTVAQEAAGTSCSCTTPALDDSTTIIDGGNIITHSVTAEQLNTTSINASKSLTIGAMATDTQASILNSNVQVGGRNLGLRSKTLDSTYGYDNRFFDRYGTPSTNDKDDGFREVLVSSNWQGIGIYADMLDLNVGETVVFSVDMENRSNVNSTAFFYAMCWDSSGTRVQGEFFDLKTRLGTGTYSSIGIYINEDPLLPGVHDRPSVQITWLQAAQDVLDNGGHICFTVQIYYDTAPTSGSTAMWAPKLENGNVPTPWTPAPEDVDASVADAAKTATNYISIDPTDGIRIADANPASASTYQRQTSTATEFVVNGKRTAQFGGSGATIGKDDELQLKMTAGKMALENDADETVFSIAEESSTTVTKTAELATFADSSEVAAATYTVSDALTAAGEPVVTLEIGGDNYVLGSEYATATATAGTGVSVELTSSGVTYAVELFDESGESGTLSVEYQASHYDKALLDMTGAMRVDGEGNAVSIANGGWSASNMSDTFFLARNDVTGKQVKFGIGSGGVNRGVWDSNMLKWLIHADDSKVYLNGGRVIVTDYGFQRDGGIMLMSGNAEASIVSRSKDTSRPSVKYWRLVLTTLGNLRLDVSSNGKTWTQDAYYWNDRSAIPVSGGGTGSTGVTGTTTVRNVITAASGVNVTSAYAYVWGKVCMLAVGFTVTESISVPASGNIPDITIGTVASAYRPKAAARLSTQAYGAVLDIDSAGKLVMTALDARGGAYTTGANTAYGTARGVYLLP